MNLNVLPAFPHRRFTKDDAVKLAQLVKEAEKNDETSECN